MKTLSAFLATAAAGTFFFVSNAAAQTSLPPCIIVNGVKCYVQYDDCQRIINIDCPGGSQGTAQFAILLPGDPCASDDNTDLESVPIKAELVPEEIDVTVNDPSLGPIRTTLDDSRVASKTTITSNPDAEDGFPLSVRIKFYAFAELEDQGTTYVSQSELVFGSDNVNSVAPFQEETFILLNDVNYYEQGDDEQRIVFTLKAGTTSLTISGEDDDDDNLLE